MQVSYSCLPDLVIVLSMSVQVGGAEEDASEEDSDY